MATTPIIMCQANDGNNDPIMGSNGRIFLTGVDAVAQIIYTTLRLLLGEWWENLSIGFPLFQSLIGNTASPQNQQGIELLIRSTIESCPYVTNVVSFSFTTNTGTMASIFTATVATSLGTIIVSNAPGSTAQVP